MNSKVQVKGINLVTWYKVAVCRKHEIVLVYGVRDCRFLDSDHKCSRNLGIKRSHDFFLRGS